MKSLRHIFTATISTILISSFPINASGTTLTVRQDGSGDFVTITDAVAAASATDTINVGSGTFKESIVITTTLTFLSQFGPDSTILDGENSHRLLLFISSVGCAVDGFSFINGYMPAGSAVFVEEGATVDISNCVFENNNASYDGGAFHVRDPATVLNIDDCVFIQNYAQHNAGAGNVIWGASCNVTNCTFYQNSTDVYCAALACGDDSNMDVLGCIFYENTSGDISGGVYYTQATGVVENNTFYGNSSPGLTGGSIVLQECTGVLVRRNIVTGDQAGSGVYWLFSTPNRSCNLFWNNADGPVTGASLAPDEIVADPLFCDPLAYDFTVSTTSNAAPAHSPCGQLIGALPTACDIEPIPAEPVILSVVDVGNDQGRQVRLIWQKSLHDDSLSPTTITGYGIYRQKGQFTSTDGPVSMPDFWGHITMTRSPLLNGWDYVATVPARGDSVYQFVAPTLCDSTITSGMCWSTFFVSAMTPDPLIYYDSEPDSGYSVDNLSPFTPQNLAGQYRPAPERLTLTWEPNTDADLFCYHIYRGVGYDFVPSGDNLIATTSEASVSGLNYLPVEPWFIKLSALDHNGNESGFAVLPPDSVVVGTFVASHRATWTGNVVEVRWVLSDSRPSLDYRVSRSVGTGGSFSELPVDVIEDGTTRHFYDRSTEPGTDYTYVVTIFENHDEVGSFTATVTTPALNYSLSPNYPNPFYSTTRIDFSLPDAGVVTLRVYDVSGRLVRTLINKKLGSKRYSEEWDGRDASGRKVPSGAYYIRLESNNKTLSRKAVLLK
jgi:hypothetical protein